MKPVYRPPGTPNSGGKAWVLPEKECDIHTAVQASQRCSKCSSYMCMTCDFPLPQGNHLCPGCALASNTDMSARRRKFVIIGLVLASIATLFFAIAMAALFAGVINFSETQAFQLPFVVTPALIGLAVSSSAQEKHLLNPISVGIAVKWNLLFLAVYTVLTAGAVCNLRYLNL